VLIVCKMHDDILKHRLRFLKNVIVPIAQHLKSFPRQARISHMIALRGKMLAAVHFDHDPAFEADKVQDEPLERHLSTEFETDKAAVPQEPPHLRFCIGRGMTHLPGVTAAAFCDRPMVKSGRH
jgi:hypothetical protein